MALLVRYVVIDGELVSQEWAAVLEDMRKDGTYFHINEGHRTLERQTYFWNCYQCQCCNNGNLAARPTPWAPHIRTGRIDHAIDFDGAANVIGWLRRMGIHASLTVPGESWHVEVDAGDLRDYFKTHSGDVYDTLPKHLEHAVRVLINRRNNVRAKIKDRDKIDSKAEPKKWEAKDKLVDKAVTARERSRKKVERLLKRARKDSTRRVLRKVLDA